MILIQTVSQSANRQDSRKRIVKAGLLLSRFLSLFTSNQIPMPHSKSQNFFFRPGIGLGVGYDNYTRSL